MGRGRIADSACPSPRPSWERKQNRGLGAAKSQILQVRGHRTDDDDGPGTQNPGSVAASGVCLYTPCGGRSVVDRDQRLVAGGGGFLDGVLDLFKGAHLDLAYALAADVEFAGEILQRDRVIAQTAGLCLLYTSDAADE